jgi:hypothetical protein
MLMVTPMEGAGLRIIISPPERRTPTESSLLDEIAQYQRSHGGAARTSRKAGDGGFQ